MERKGIIFSNKDGAFKRLDNGVVVPYKFNRITQEGGMKNKECLNQKKSYKTT